DCDRTSFDTIKEEKPLANSNAPELPESVQPLEIKDLQELAFIVSEDVIKDEDAADSLSISASLHEAALEIEELRNLFSDYIAAKAQCGAVKSLGLEPIDPEDIEEDIEEEEESYSMSKNQS